MIQEVTAIKFWYNKDNESNNIAILNKDGTEKIVNITDILIIKLYQNAVLNIIFNSRYKQQHLKENSLIKLLMDNGQLKIIIDDAYQYVDRMDVDGFETLL